MLLDERAKLSFIEDEANNFSIQVNLPSNIALFDSGILNLNDSSTVTWDVSDMNLTANLAFPLESVHRHYYNITPDHENIITPDYKNYIIPFTIIEDSARIYVNGIKLNPDQSVWIPLYSASWNPAEDWLLISYSITGTSLVLSNNLSVYDKISIDFDISLS
jgi:hypothetical protein